MKKQTGHWLKRARKKLKITQKDLVGDKFKRQYISMVETGDVDLSYKAREYITRKLKLPKKYFDTGLFTDEKKRLDELIKDIDILLDHLKFDEALKKVTEALKISQEAKNDYYTNNLLIKLTRVYIKKKKLNKAEDLLSNVNKYYSEEKDYKNLAYSYYWTGVLHRENKNYEDAILTFNKAIEENEKLRRPDKSLKARALTKIAQIYRLFIENYKGAKHTYQRAIEIAKKAKDDDILATAYWGYGLLLEKMGEYSKAVKYNNLASTIFKDLKNEKSFLEINNNLASNYYYMGDYDKTINLTKKVVKISREKGYKEELSYALLNSAKAKRDIGLLDEAESDLKESIVLFEKSKDERMLGVSYMSMGLVYKKRKENDLAIKSFIKAIEIFKELGQPIYINSAYGEIIRFYKDIGDFDKEKEYTEELINITKRAKF